MPPQMSATISSAFASFLIGALAAAMPAQADATGPLPEGDGGFFCKTHDGIKRLFRRGDFSFCTTDARLPTRVTYAVIGEAPANLAGALRRFGDRLAARAGIAIEPSKQPDVLLVASPATPPPKGREAYRGAVEAMLAKSGVSLPPDLPATAYVDLDLTADFSLNTLLSRRPPGRPYFAATSFYAGPGADLDKVVETAFTTFLAIEAPMVRPEEIAKTPDGVSHAFRLRHWLDP